MYSAQTLSFSSPQVFSSVLFESVLQHVEPGNSVDVIWCDKVPNFVDLTSWRKIKRSFGHSAILYPEQLRGELSNAISKIRWLQRCHVTIRVVRTADLLEEEWKRILRNPHQWFRDSSHYSFNDLLRLQAIYSNKPASNLRDRALSKVQDVMLCRYGMRKPPSLIMKVPHGALRFTRMVHRALTHVVTSLSLHDEVKSNLLNNFRIANTRRATISDILVNSRKHAKAFEAMHEPMCTNECKSKNHDLRVGCDFEGVVKHILTQYARDIPVFTTVDSKFELFSAFRNVLSSLDKLLVDDMHDQTLVEQFDTCSANFTIPMNFLKRAASERLIGHRPSVCHVKDDFLVRNMLHAYVVVELDKKYWQIGMHVSCKVPQSHEADVCR